MTGSHGKPGDSGSATCRRTLSTCNLHPHMHAGRPNPNQSKPGQRHLYVALDDSKGYALYKLNVDDLADMDSDVVAGAEDLHRLPEPVIRLGFRSFGKHAHFNPLGSNIVVTGTAGKDPHDEAAKSLTLVYDTKTGTQEIGQYLPDGLQTWYETFVASDKLYAFCPTRLPLHYLDNAQEQPEFESNHDNGDDNDDDDDIHDDDSNDGDNNDDDDIHDDDSDDGDNNEDDGDDDDDDDRARDEEQWTWKRSPVSIPFTGDDEHSIKHSSSHVLNRAVHPDGHTIFMAAVDWRRPGTMTGTLSWDTGQRRDEWTRHGDWHLPFICQAYYDHALDAWVGFCLVEITRRKGTKVRCSLDDDHLLQVTMFDARYGKNGELMATPCRPGRTYLIPRYDPSTINKPPAFWIIADKYVLSHVNANVRFSLVPHDGKKPAPAKLKHYRSSFGGVFKFNGHVIGERSRFMGRDQLEKSGYVVDDCFIVRCDIDVVVTSAARVVGSTATDACDDLVEAELPCSSMVQEDMCKHEDNVVGGHATDTEDPSDIGLAKPHRSGPRQPKMMMHPMAATVFSCFADFF
uniref:Uncharacterized protein n=1 Tax=Aegilops tauschii TaxID=37682 RepID=N1QVZ9_AEGTA